MLFWESVPIGEDRLASYNRINETYTEISYLGNRPTMLTPGDTTTLVNTTETGKLKLKTPIEWYYSC